MTPSRRRAAGASSGKVHGQMQSIKQQDLPLKMAIRQFSTRAVSVLGYKAQMVLPLPDIIRTELSGILMALKLAGNSMNADCAFKLRVWVGANPTRPSIYCEAYMIRAAWKTFGGFH